VEQIRDPTNRSEVRFHPDEAVSVRRVWLWLRTEGLSFPMQTRYGGGVRWVDPS
jgi:hypothetical protein